MVEVVGVLAHVNSFLPAHLAAVPLLVAEVAASGAAGSFAVGMPVVTVVAVPTPAGQLLQGGPGALPVAAPAGRLAAGFGA
jgi:hypothetical protein